MAAGDRYSRWAQPELSRNVSREQPRFWSRYPYLISGNESEIFSRTAENPGKPIIGLLIIDVVVAAQTGPNRLLQFEKAAGLLELQLLKEASVMAEQHICACMSS